MSQEEEPPDSWKIYQLSRDASGRVVKEELHDKDFRRQIYSIITEDKIADSSKRLEIIAGLGHIVVFAERGGLQLDFLKEPHLKIGAMNGETRYLHSSGLVVILSSRDHYQEWFDRAGACFEQQSIELPTKPPRYSCSKRHR
jgi:hypothetical protein